MVEEFWLTRLYNVKISLKFVGICLWTALVSSGLRLHVDWAPALTWFFSFTNILLLICCCWVTQFGQSCWTDGFTFDLTSVCGGVICWLNEHKVPNSYGFKTSPKHAWSLYEVFVTISCLVFTKCGAVLPLIVMEVLKFAQVQLCRLPVWHKAIKERQTSTHVHTDVLFSITN